MTVLGVLLVGAGALAMGVGGLGCALCFSGEARGATSAILTVLGGYLVLVLGLYTLGAA